MKNLDDEFAKFVNGKRVSLVGPAEYMQGSSFGSEIEKSDVVIRINRSYESVGSYRDDIGSRTDLLYSCLIEKSANAGILDIKILSEAGVQFICAPPASNMKGMSSETKIHQMVNIEKVHNISRQIPIRIVNHQFHNWLAGCVLCRPNTGFMAIYDILRFQPEMLNLYGFSFYLDGFIEGVKEGIEKEQNKTQQEFAIQCFNSKRHVQKNMWNFAKQTLLDRENVSLDPILQGILSMNEFTRDSFKGFMSDHSRSN